MPDLNSLYYINVGPHGTFAPSGNLTTTKADIDAIFLHLSNNNIQKLVLHFHGGLVNEHAGFGIAKSMTPLYQEAGAHPITIIWETGFLETTTGNLSTIHKTKLFNIILKYVIKYAQKKLGVSIGGKGPGQAMTDAEIDKELVSGKYFSEIDAGIRGGALVFNQADLDEIKSEIEAELEVELAGNTEIEEILGDASQRTSHFNEDEYNEVMGARGVFSSMQFAATLAQVVYQVIKRHINKHDHGFYPTVMEEIIRALYLADFGEWVWGGMKDIAGDMWKPGNVGAYLLLKLADLKNSRPDLIVDLVGHSAGSIAICNMLDAITQRHPGILSLRNVLFLAPACTMELFHDQIVTKPERFLSFRMFTMRDELERSDNLVPVIYPRSLLYFISGVLEGTADMPIAGLELQGRGQVPYNGDSKLVAVHGFLTETGKDRLVLSKTIGAAAGMGSEAVKHGDFDNDPATRESLKAIISKP